MLKKMSVLTIGLVLFISTAFAAVFEIDTAHSQVNFTIAHMALFKVRGVFTKFTGKIIANPAQKTIESIEGNVAVNSITTHVAKRDGHLKSKDFFDAEGYPNLIFVSKKITGSGESITVYGDLTIRNVTKPVTLKGAFIGTAKDPWGNVKAGFEATGQISRKDFGLTYNQTLETGGLLIGENVSIKLEIQAAQKN